MAETRLEPRAALIRTRLSRKWLALEGARDHLGGMPEPGPSKPPVGQSAVSAERIAGAILLLRGQRVILDSSLAGLYEVETNDLVRAVKRNADRFPDDFAFQLSLEEFKNLRLQSGASSSWGGRRYRPYAFTEQGVAMLSSVLRSPRAVRVNVEIMRAFVRLRQLLESNADLAHRLAELERRYDGQFKVVFEAIRDLMAQPAPEPKRIGFKTESRRGALGLKSRLGKGTP